MLEYVRRLLLAQTRLAAQFDTAPQPEIREIALRAERETGDAQEQNTQSREKRPGLMQAGAEMDGTETWSGIWTPTVSLFSILLKISFSGWTSIGTDVTGFGN